MKLSLHILRAHVGPFIFAFITLMFIFLLQFLMRAVDQLIGKGLSAWVIAELLALSLSWMVVLAVPMAVLVATLMAFGKLSSQNEVTAMKASGMSLYRMIFPVLLLSMLVTYELIEFNNKVLPEANHKFKVLMIDIRRKKPTLAIQAGLFSQDLQGYSILARKTFEQSNDLEGVTIYDYTNPIMNVVVTAEKGKVSFTPDYRKLVMDLYDGEIHELNIQSPDQYRRMRFTQHRIIMDAEGFEFDRTGDNAIEHGDRELSAQDMEVMVDNWQRANQQAQRQALSSPIVQNGRSITDPRYLQLAHNTMSIEQQARASALNKARSVITNINNQQMLIDYNQQQIDQYSVEIQKKYSIPFACIVFVFLGAPLGIIARRGTFGVAASFSIGFFVIYWASLIAGERFADRGLMSPWLGMWMANIVLSFVGIYLTIRMARETPTINWQNVRKFIPKVLRPSGQTHDEPSADEHARV